MDPCDPITKEPAENDESNANEDIKDIGKTLKKLQDDTDRILGRGKYANYKKYKKIFSTAKWLFYILSLLGFVFAVIMAAAACGQSNKYLYNTGDYEEDEINFTEFQICLSMINVDNNPPSRAESSIPMIIGITLLIMIAFDGCIWWVMEKLCTDSRGCMKSCILIFGVTSVGVIFVSILVSIGTTTNIWIFLESVYSGQVCNDIGEIKKMYSWFLMSVISGWSAIGCLLFGMISHFVDYKDYFGYKDTEFSCAGCVGHLW